MTTKKYYQKHKEDILAKNKQYYQRNKDDLLSKKKQYREVHKDEILAYNKSDVNSKGMTKKDVRSKSSHYLYKTLKFQKIDGYEIHHCFGYDYFKHFIYITKALHLEIHKFLRDNGIKADSNHFELIKLLLDSCKEKIFIIIKDGEITEYK